METTTPPVDLSVRNGVAHLRLNRPHASNALDLAMAKAFAAAVTELNSDAVHAVVLSGAGPRFCVGGDLASMQQAEDESAYVYEMATRLDAALVALEELDRPVVAAVHGAVAGAGLAIMLSADVIIADPKTRFSAGYAQVALSPDCGASYLLAQAMGVRPALLFTLMGVTLSADQARAQGLIAEVSESDPVILAIEIASSWAAGAHKALGTTRQIIRGSVTAGRRATGATESEAIAAAASSDASRTRRAAFLTRQSLKP